MLGRQNGLLWIITLALAGFAAAQGYPVLFQLWLLLTSALFFGNLARRMGQPAVLGEILAGIILGPTVLGWLAPDVQPWLFSKNQIAQAIAYIGLILFVFTAGLEVNLAYVRRRRRSALLTSISGVILPFALGFGMVTLLPWLWSIPSGDLRIFALFMGTALSISALPVIARILMDLDLMKKELGSMIISAATIDDIIGWSLFALILSILNTGMGLALNLSLTVGALALTIYVIHLEARNDAILHFRHIGSLIYIVAISGRVCNLLNWDLPVH